MPLQNVPMLPLDAALDDETRQKRRECEKLCQEGRQQWERKNALLWSLTLAGVVVAALLAHIMQGG